MEGGYSRKSVLTGITSFLIRICWPLGMIMIFMEHVLSSTASSLCGFHDGSKRLAMVYYWSVCKGHDNGDYLQGLLFWTG